ncbi:protein FAM166C A [Anguilla anguilla]|uniref:protein FAM166C A n=1 Tax=Anguilla anguilla TaxID=7936 RepID=UPI0015ADCFFD|nr:protein FAM166C A [Anguilla anguilla]
MSQRSVGTLSTHNNAIYVSPAVMPGYGGYVPTVRFSYGDTFGNATAKHFQDYRYAAMSTSTSPYSLGCMFPSIYSNNPGLAPGSACRGPDRRSYSPYWASKNVGFDRQAEFKHFDQLAHQHREHYLDTTGTRLPVPYFVTAHGHEEERAKG